MESSGSDIERRSLLPQGQRHKAKQTGQEWYDNHDAHRLLGVCVLLGLTCVVMMIIGTFVHSLALISNAIHMLSDVVSFLIGLYALRAARRAPTDTMTFGFVRAEVLGGLFNGCFLLSICFFVFLEAIHAFFEQPEESDGKTVAVVALVGLLVNATGLFLLRDHAHGHQHTHGSSDLPAHSPHRERNLNLYAVFLHLMSDCMASVGVVISGVLADRITSRLRFYIDPIASVFIAIFIAYNAAQLVRMCSSILAQQVPAWVELASIKKDISQISGVRGFHDVHVWQLIGRKAIGSVHVHISPDADVTTLIRGVRHVFTEHGVASVTIEPEPHGDEGTSRSDV